MLKKYTFKSDKQGYNVLFLGAVHGNEPCGPQAIFKIVEKFASHAIAPLKGSVSFIPICNPKAFENNVRQIDENLNRIIQKYPAPKTYEQSLADELDGHIAAADVIIDLHSTYCPAAEPFIFNDYPGALADKLAKTQDIKYIVEGWPQIYAMSETVKDLSTGNCAHKYGRTCLTVECGHHFAEKSVQTAYYVILNALLTLNMLEGFPSATKEQKTIVMKSIFIKEKDGKLAKAFKHLDFVRKGDTLAIYDDGSTVVCPEDSYVLLPKEKAPVNSEWFYLGLPKDASLD